MPRRPQSIATTLRSLQQMGIGQQALAREAEVAQSIISRITSGERSMTPEVAGKLAAALERIAAHCTEASQKIRAAGHHPERRS